MLKPILGHVVVRDRTTTELLGNFPSEKVAVLATVVALGTARVPNYRPAMR